MRHTRQVRGSSKALLYGYSLSRLRDVNRSTVLRVLHWHPGLSRREIARQTGLDASTISHIIDEFLTSGLVRERGAAPPLEQPRRGRRQIGLELLPTAAYAIGIHLGVRSVRVAACDLHGQIVSRRASVLEPGTSPAAAMADIVRLVQSVLGEDALQGQRLVGIGIGAVAFLDPTSGVIQSAPSLGWGQVDMSGPLYDQLGLPVLLDHHVRAMAMAEQWFGVAHNVPDFALVNVDTSVGIGLVINGHLVRGDNARAGQIAHMVVAEEGPLCTCGRRGCLVMLASYRALAARAAEIVAEYPDTPLAHAIAEHPAMPAEYVVFDLADEGEPVSRQFIDDMAGYIADSITHLVSLLDPSLVVLAAGSAKHATMLLEPVRQRVARRAPLMPNGTPRIITSALGRDLAVLGGAALAFERFIDGPSEYLLSEVPPVAVTTEQARPSG